MTNNLLSEQNNPQGALPIQSIESLKQQTKISVLDAFYRDESMFGKVFSIISGKKINPADLVEHISTARGVYKELDAVNDPDFEQAA